MRMTPGRGRAHLCWWSLIFNNVSTLKLERLANHHLHANLFIGYGGVDTDYDAFGPGPHAETDIPKLSL